MDGLDYVLFDTLPPELSNPTTDRLIIDRVTKEITVYMEPPTPKTELELLREENADLKSRISDVEMFVADMMIGGI